MDTRPFWRRHRLMLLRGLGIAILSCLAFSIGIGVVKFVSPEHGSEPTPPQPWPTTPLAKPLAAPLAPQKPSARPTTVKLEIPDSRKCPELSVGFTETCRSIAIRNTGTRTVELATDELEGDDFTVSKPCNGRLEPDTACTIRVRFHPTAAGPRVGVVVLRVQPGGLERLITITGTASAG